MKSASLTSPKPTKCKLCSFYTSPFKAIFSFRVFCISLTDDDTRRNYEEYGHPDGKQSFTMGVALPKGLVEGNGMFVLGFYALAFGLGLPYFIVSILNSSDKMKLVVLMTMIRLNGGINLVA